MEKQTEDIFRLLCPCCGTVLWVDAVTGEIMQFEKRAEKKKDSLEDLLLKEKKKKEEMERKFEATAELEKKKLEKAKEKFAKALADLKEEEKD